MAKIPFDTPSLKSLTFIDNVDATDLESQAMEGGLLRIMPHSFYLSFSFDKIKVLMYRHGLYVLPTTELIEYLRANIIGSAIEIGAGHGAIGRNLQIPVTDNHMQNWPAIKKQYEMYRQPVIQYPPDVERLDYRLAMIKYKSDTVIGAFITHKWKPGLENGNQYGVDEGYVLRHSKRYMMVGNLSTHNLKPILSRAHREEYYPWLITRSNDQSQNRIFTWDNLKKQ